MNQILLDIWHWLGSNTAEVIASCALFLTAYQFFSAKRHNKLSVKPLLSESAQKTQNPNDGEFKFFVANNGLGPAIITKFKVTLNSVELRFKEYSSVENVLKTMLKEEEVGFKIGALGVGYVMPPNEKQDVLHIHCRIKNDDDFKNIDKILNKLELIIEYSSMYGNHFKLDTRENN